MSKRDALLVAQATKRGLSGSFLHYQMKAATFTMLVPVIDSSNKPLMPCSQQRASYLIRSNNAKRCWRKGIFCIKLNKEIEEPKLQPIALGIDPGSKREGYTVATPEGVVLNITSNTPDWVKDHIESRAMLRRTRRYRKTPYRKCRSNRSKQHFLPPSTKARWGAKLRIVACLLKILPITVINVEDIKAVAKKGKKQWNASFSPLEVGKQWFYSELEKLGIELIKTEGKQTSKHRNDRGFKKSKNKLDFVWTAHNIDSHVLVEMVLKTEVQPFFGLYRISFLEYYRRVLHAENPKRNGYRSLYGSTVSLGMSRGSVVRWNKKSKTNTERLYYLGGTSKNRVSLHSLDGNRMARNVNKEDIKVLYITKHTTQHKGGAISHTVGSVAQL